MRNGAVAGHAERGLVRIGFQPRDELLEVLDLGRDSGADEDTELEPHELADRNEILRRVKTRRGLDHRQQIHRRSRGHEDGGAIGIGSFHRLDTDQAITAGAVLDDDVAVEQGADVLRQQAAQRVAAAAGRERKDDFGQRTRLRQRLAGPGGQ
jgi:hypothetical protein